MITCDDCGDSYSENDVRSYVYEPDLILCEGCEENARESE